MDKRRHMGKDKEGVVFLVAPNLSEMGDGYLEFINEIKEKIKKQREVLQKFDRHVFESITDRIIVGEKGENGQINPYKLKIIFKTGYERDEVASEQPFSFENTCSYTTNDCGIISPQGDNDTL